jgi:hypothetical protein
MEMEHGSTGTTGAAEATQATTTTQDTVRQSDSGGSTGAGASVHTAANTGSGNDAGASSATGAATPEQQAPIAYTPTLKFKVKDKELDFDDFVKPIIKDKETEAKLRDLYEKAYGLDEVKADRTSLKEKVRASEEKYSQVETSLKALGQYAQKKDFRTFFDILSIPKQDIINYAIEELKYQELPAEQRAMVDAQRQRELEYEAQVTQTQTMQKQMQDLVLQQVTMELNQELARPDYAQAQSAYDARVGRPGALKAEIIRRGQYYEAVHKTSPPASQLVAEVLQLVGAMNPVPQNGVGASQGTLATQSQAVQPQNKPVIPSFSSGGASKSPVKKQPTSIDDLRKLRQQQHTT